MQKVSKNANVFQMCAFYVQQCFMLAQATGNAILAQQAAMDMQSLGMSSGGPVGGQLAQLNTGGDQAESGVTKNSRQRTANATEPREG